MELDSDEAWTHAYDLIESLAERDEMPLEDFYSAWSVAQRTHRGLYRAWITSLARHQTAEWLGDASNVHTPHVLWLADHFPEAKFIHLFRDPRDVASSQKAVWDTSATRAAMRWRREISTHHRARKTLGADRYYYLKYEDLVTFPETQIRALCLWMGWTFLPSMLNAHLRKDRGFASREHHKEGTLSPMTVSRIGRYRARLSPEEIQLIETLCGDGMRTLGYTPDHTNASTTPLRSITLFAKQSAQMLFEQTRAQWSAKTK